MSIERVKVTGVTFYKGEVNGDDIDSGSVFIEEALDFTKGRAKGKATQKYPLGNAEAAKSIMHNEFPLLCEVEFVRVTNGKMIRNVVNAIKPVAKAA